MNIYILPVQRVLLEYVLKLGDMIFFPWSASEEDIEASSLLEKEKELLKLVLQKNYSFFKEYLMNSSCLLLFSQYDINEIKSDITIFEKILDDANRRFDYIRILECPFHRLEYTIGIPGVLNGKRILISIDNDHLIGTYIDGREEFYSMQRGIGLDLGAKENNDSELYDIIYSERKDEVYNLYRKCIAEACEALQIIDETRCFVFLFSKLDGLGLCETYSFSDNKKRIISMVSDNQNKFNIISSELYFYSKEIRTEIVHKGKKIDELISIREANEINQKLFNIIIQFCIKVISTGITSIEMLKEYISNEVIKYAYITPQERILTEIPFKNYSKTVYVASIDGIQIDYPEKRGNYLLLPSLEDFSYKRYYDNYILKVSNDECENIFNDFSIDDLEYILEILVRCERDDDKFSRIIGLNLPKIEEEDIYLAPYREQFVDNICNKLNECLYYDILSGGDILNGEILPPRIGIKDGIRAIYEFIEGNGKLFLRFLPGRIFSEYQIPVDKYNCVTMYKDDIYEILFYNENYIEDLCKRALVDICESEYIRDWTQQICQLFNIFDGLDPRSYNKKKVIKLVFTMLSTNKAEYLKNKQEYDQLKNKYRNPLLHGGKCIFEIESDINKLENIALYLRKIIIDYCLKIHLLNISTWEELDNMYKKQQKDLKL